MDKTYIGCCGRYYCKKCAYYTGEIVESAKTLLRHVEKYGSLRLIAESQKDFYYPELRTTLEWLALRKPCRGCRHGGGWSWWPDCPVRQCILEKGIDFCFACDSFPCDKIESNPMRDRILRANKYLAAHEPHESVYDPALNP